MPIKNSRTNMDKMLIEEIIKVENRYSQLFSELKITEMGLRFTDKNILDMHCHNFIRVEKENIKHIVEIVETEMMFRKENGQSTIQVEFFDTDLSAEYDSLGDINTTTQIVMYAKKEDLVFKERNINASIHIAESDSDFEKGKNIDILNSDDVDFPTRRYERKIEKYKNPDSGINNVICYKDDELMGNCDFFISGKFGKIEDFDVVEKYQRKGFGSGIIKEIYDYGTNDGVEIFFLQVESDNSALDMYKKIGFTPLFLNIIYNRKID